MIHLINPKEIHHLKNVLRLKKGDRISLFDDTGYEVVGKIQSISKHSIPIEKEYHLPRNNDANKIHLALACAIPKRTKFETIIEKCTELGVDEIIPLKTQRTEVQLNQEQALRKAKRYQTVAMNAAKQSRRRTIPQIHPLIKYPDYIATLKLQEKILIPCLSGDNQSLADSFKEFTNIKRLTFLIGPEGDFTPREIEQAKEKGVKPISLGSTVLKVDTAAMTVIAYSRLFFQT